MKSITFPIYFIIVVHIPGNFIKNVLADGMIWHSILSLVLHLRRELASSGHIQEIDQFNKKDFHDEHDVSKLLNRISVLQKRVIIAHARISY